jgi:hypothetical protein
LLAKLTGTALMLFSLEWRAFLLPVTTVKPSDWPLCTELTCIWDCRLREWESRLAEGSSLTDDAGEIGSALFAGAEAAGAVFGAGAAREVDAAGAAQAVEAADAVIGAALMMGAAAFWMAAGAALLAAGAALVAAGAALMAAGAASGLAPCLAAGAGAGAAFLAAGVGAAAAGGAATASALDALFFAANDDSCICSSADKLAIAASSRCTAGVGEAASIFRGGVAL